jgi:hypothetical protein
MAGRIALTFESVDPQDPNKSYFFFEDADNAIPGTALNKFNLLQDITALLLGLDPTDDPTVNDAFWRIGALIGGGGGVYLGASYLGAAWLASGGVSPSPPPETPPILPPSDGDTTVISGNVHVGDSPPDNTDEHPLWYKTGGLE